MEETFKRGAVAFALLLVGATGAEARHHGRLPTHCATPTELTAVAATSIQQELMVAALTCNQIPNFNAFQTNFGLELRSSDRALMRMFTRLYGGKGPSEYHGFKTRLANNSEMRSIQGNSEFCTATSQVFAAALGPIKPSLSDFVSGVAVNDPSPVDSCQMQVTLGLQGAMAATNIVPRQKPAEFQEVALVGPAPLPQQAAQVPSALQSAPAPQPATGPATSSVAAAAPTAAAPPVSAAGTAPATAAADQASQPPKKKSGWFSGLFN